MQRDLGRTPLVTWTTRMGDARSRVVMDPPDEGELRGDEWREVAAARGRGVKRRTHDTR